MISRAWLGVPVQVFLEVTGVCQNQSPERKTCPKCEQYSKRLGVGQNVEAFNPSTQET